MDASTGRIDSKANLLKDGVPEEYIYEFQGSQGQGPRLEPCKKVLSFDALPEDVREEVKKTGKGFLTRNSRCPCESGKKFKRCCMIRGR